MSLSWNDAGVEYEGLSVKWEGLREVSIVTTAGGPFEDDVLFVLIGEGGTCIVPHSDPGCASLLERLQRLPGFDNEALIEAMGSPQAGRFVCWSTPEQ